MRSLAALALLACVCLLAARAARAMQYEVFVDVETEQELHDLRNEGQISERSFEALRALMSRPVDLNRSSRASLLSLPNIDEETVDRILRHRSATGTMNELQELVEAGILTQEQVRSLRPFVVVARAKRGDERRARGFLRLQTRFSGRYDRYPPATALQARLDTTGGLHLGLAASLLRNQPGRARYDRRRNALSAPPPRARLVLPKLFLLWEGKRVKLVVGTYRIGFGQSLVFDTTAAAAPRGFAGDDELRRPSTLVRRCRERAEQPALRPCRDGGRVRVTPDFGWTPRLTGLSIGFRRDSASGRYYEMHAWASYQVHGASQYELRLPAQCPDPRRDEDSACSAPTVLVRRDLNHGAQSQWTSTSFPRMFVEALGGANLSFFWNGRSHIGITGYGAKLRWTAKGVKLGLQETARQPFGGPFGAMGLHLAYGKRRQDFQLELARSFDRQSRARGGWAALAQSLSTLRTAQIVLSVRYYASQYANPHARPISAADELDGLRARDEAGLRMRARIRLGERWTATTSADVWRELSTSALKSELRLRADFEPTTRWGGSVWAAQRTGEGKHAITTSARLLGRPSQRVRVSLRLQHAATGSRARTQQFARALAAIATFTAHPSEHARLTLRLRYDRELKSSAKAGRQSLGTYLSAAFDLRRGNGLRLRYDFRLTVDGASAASPQSLPSPENWLALEYLWRSN